MGCCDVFVLVYVYDGVIFGVVVGCEVISCFLEFGAVFIGIRGLGVEVCWMNCGALKIKIVRGGVCV